MWKNLENIRRQVEDGAKEFAQAAIEGVRDLKAQQGVEDEFAPHSSDVRLLRSDVGIDKGDRVLSTAESRADPRSTSASVSGDTGSLAAQHGVVNLTSPSAQLLDAQNGHVRASKASHDQKDKVASKDHHATSSKSTRENDPIDPIDRHRNITSGPDVVAGSSSPLEGTAHHDATSGVFNKSSFVVEQSLLPSSATTEVQSASSYTPKPMTLKETAPSLTSSVKSGHHGVAPVNDLGPELSSKLVSSSNPTARPAIDLRASESQAAAGPKPLHGSSSTIQATAVTTAPSAEAAVLKVQVSRLQGAGPSHHNSDGDDIRHAYAEMKKAYDDMKTLLKKSMDECVRLSEEVMRLETECSSARHEATEWKEANKTVSKQVAESRAKAAAAKREVEEMERSLTHTRRELQEERGRHAEEAGTAELEVLRSELANAVRKATAAVVAAEASEDRAKAAEAAMSQAEAARNESDRLRREAQIEAHAAVSAAEAERSTRAEAEGLSEALRQDGERRARVFNNAVRAAIGKVQRELEAERDELQCQLREMQKALLDSKTELKRALVSEEAAVAEAAARTADAVAVGQVADAAEHAAERARLREEEATQRAAAAESARRQAEAEVSTLRLDCTTYKKAAERAEAECAELRSEAMRLQASLESRVEDLQGDLERWRDRAETASTALIAAEQNLEQAQAKNTEAVKQAQFECAAALCRVEELEAQLQTMKTSSGVMSRLFQIPTKEDVLAGLGLEMCQDDRLRWKQGSDIEAAGGAGAATPVATRPRGKGVANGGSADLLRGAGGKVLGAVSLRIWLIAAYLTLLHIAVMVSFTHSSAHISDVTAVECEKLMLVKAHEQILP
ncbi:hypothetical protein CEUSTIGMA_g4453.t1 [Chlamydomonas eustigma]|uniref:Uncharacterized protein n=1 Tax=Chlamydomonas eustigma TaxID=1157962 RepID=A0A250X1S4_9CHLO|nr:hypothetical protein CEUSTIGMA_g4453.t1 [Chlamydomonas eustigma]|eukprot:GAX77006.1 hypothetical protein CEUSTIGMA_g4453.t1 [Chlamydomonas eustigma]